MKRATAKKQLPKLLNRYRKKLAADTKLRNRKPNDPRLPEVQAAAEKRKVKAIVKAVKERNDKLREALDAPAAAETVS